MNTSKEQDAGQGKRVVNATESIQLLTNDVSHIPKIMFFTKGKRTHKDRPTNFELVLFDSQTPDVLGLSPV